MQIEIHPLITLFQKLIENCPASHSYDVYGLDTPQRCCYKYHKFCGDVDCEFKSLIQDYIDRKENS